MEAKSAFANFLTISLTVPQDSMVFDEYKITTQVITIGEWLKVLHKVKSVFVTSHYPQGRDAVELGEFEDDGDTRVIDMVGGKFELLNILGEILKDRREMAVKVSGAIFDFFRIVEAGNDKLPPKDEIRMKKALEALLEFTEVPWDVVCHYVPMTLDASGLKQRREWEGEPLFGHIFNRSDQDDDLDIDDEALAERIVKTNRRIREEKSFWGGFIGALEQLQTDLWPDRNREHGIG